VGHKRPEINLTPITPVQNGLCRRRGQGLKYREIAANPMTRRCRKRFRLDRLSGKSLRKEQKGTQMIPRYLDDTALLLIDTQKGVHSLSHWGGPTGRMNNPDCQDNLGSLLAGFRAAVRTVAFTRHDSREPDSPLKLSLPTGDQLPGLEPRAADIVVEKHVNSGFLGTSLDIDLRRAGIRRLVIAGYFTNFCVETTTRMAGNMGYDVYLVHDACATTNRIGLDSTDYDPDLVHAMAIASMNGEFCTALTTAQALGLLTADNRSLSRLQGNETTSAKPELRRA
jgi:nicotinamidase-related amidase